MIIFEASLATIYLSLLVGRAILHDRNLRAPAQNSKKAVNSCTMSPKEPDI